jgi:cysteine desulfurase / selenocysteine lyase
MVTTAQTSRPTSDPGYDVYGVREDFPILSRKVHGLPLVYLDNAATCQKPRQVIEAVDRYYRDLNANIHRGLHALSEEATAQYEAARDKVRRFLNANAVNEIIFTRGTTESINLIAQSYARSVLRPGDEVLITHMEHHSNIVPWQIVCNQTGAKLRVAPINDRGELILDEFQKLLGERVRVVSISHVSNALGTINPIRQLIKLTQDAGAVAVIDGAQAVPHLRVDVRDLNADFYAFSSHKLYGPTGVGVLYGKASLLEAMPPYQGGGDMIKSVTFEKTIYNDLPYKFEAGTPNIAGGIGLGAAIDYVGHLRMDRIAAWENNLLEYGTSALESIKGVRLIGTAASKAAVLSFVLDCAHPHDIGTILDRMGIAIRTGHHCAQPVMDRFNIAATARASFAAYNTKEDIDALVRGIEKVREVFA